MTVSAEGNDVNGPYIILDDGIDEAEVSKLKNRKILSVEDAYVKFVGIVSSKLGVSRDCIQEDTQLKSICVDSLDFVEMLMAVEVAFDVIIEDKDTDMMFTVLDVFNCAFEKMVIK